MSTGTPSGVIHVYLLAGEKRSNSVSAVADEVSFSFVSGISFLDRCGRDRQTSAVRSWLLTAGQWPLTLGHRQTLGFVEAGCSFNVSEASIIDTTAVCLRIDRLITSG